MLGRPTRGGGPEACCPQFNLIRELQAKWGLASKAKPPTNQIKPKQHQVDCWLHTCKLRHAPHADMHTQIHSPLPHGWMLADYYKSVTCKMSFEATSQLSGICMAAGRNNKHPSVFSMVDQKSLQGRAVRTRMLLSPTQRDINEQTPRGRASSQEGSQEGLR